MTSSTRVQDPAGPPMSDALRVWRTDVRKDAGLGRLVPEDFALSSLANDAEWRVVEAFRDS